MAQRVRAGADLHRVHPGPATETAGASPHERQNRLPVLATRLYAPRPRPDRVARPALLALLDGALHVPLTVVIAPAGFGKTTLAATWIAGRPPAAIAWLSLSDDDNDPTTFVRYLVAALQTVAPDIGASVLDLLYASQPEMRTLLLLLLNDLAATTGELVLALDDYHLIGEPAIHAAMTFLIDHLPPHVHLLLLSRADPPLPLARLRGRRQLLEIRTAKLRFTTPEIQAFLAEAMGLSLTADQVAELERRTEGWIAGLQFAALALRERTDAAAFLAGFSGSHRYVIDYLAAEVLDHMPAHLRTFVLTTAILERLCGPLCDAVLGLEGAADPAQRGSYSQLLLAELERMNMFLVPLDDERTWYRYHHLFADVLRNHLQTGASPQAISDLHRQASVWFAAQGFAGEAVYHALAAGDHLRAAELIETVALEMVLHGQTNTLTTWLQPLPATMADERPRLCLARIWAAFGRFDYGAVDLDVQRIEATLNGLQPAEAELLRAELAAARSIMLSFRDDPRAVGLGRQALAVLPESYLAYGVVTVFYGIANYRRGNLTAASSALEHALQLEEPALTLLVNRIGLLAVLSSTRHMQGRLHETLQLASAVQSLATRGGRLFPSTATARSLLETGSVLRELNRLTEAEEQLQRCIELTRQFGGHGYRILAYFYLAQVYHSRGELTAAQGALGQAFTVMHTHRSWPATRQELDGYRILLAIAAGDLATAREWLAGYQPVARPEQAALTPFAYDRFAHARTLMAMERWPEAQAALASLTRDAATNGFGYFLVWACCLQALTYQATGQTEQALAALDQALVQAAPEGLVCVFADEGAPMAALLDARTAHLAGKDPLAAYVGHLRQTCLPATALPPAAAPAWAAALVEPLTERELEVLRLICSGASNRVIADELVISVGTVKKHVNNILGKFGVHSRTQAIAMARELGIC